MTLEVTPAQAEEIDLARSIGTLSLVLRNQADRDSVSTRGARKNDLLRTDLRETGREIRPASSATPIARQTMGTKTPINPGTPSDRMASAASLSTPTMIIRGLTASVE